MNNTVAKSSHFHSCTFLFSRSMFENMFIFIRLYILKNFSFNLPYYSFIFLYHEPYGTSSLRLNLGFVSSLIVVGSFASQQSIQSLISSITLDCTSTSIFTLLERIELVLVLVAKPSLVPRLFYPAFFAHSIISIFPLSYTSILGNRIMGKLKKE